MARLIRTDRNGTRYFEEIVNCDKCGGAGTYEWGGFIDGRPRYSGVCYKCGGTGRTVDKWKEYTPEHRAKLDKRREAKVAKEHAKSLAEAAQREAERMEQEAEDARREAAEAARKAISQYVGSVGDKIRLAVTLDSMVNYEIPTFAGCGRAPKMTVYTFVDASGNKLVWKTRGCLDASVGQGLTITGTIKAHSEYKEEKQTELMRVRAERSP